MIMRDAADTVLPPYGMPNEYLGDSHNLLDLPAEEPERFARAEDAIHLRLVSRMDVSWLLIDSS